MTGDLATLQVVAQSTTARIAVTRTEWALGLEACIRALASDDDAADDLYRESIQRLGRTSVRPQLARSHLLYGE